MGIGMGFRSEPSSEIGKIRTVPESECKYCMLKCGLNMLCCQSQVSHLFVWFSIQSSWLVELINLLCWAVVCACNFSSINLVGELRCQNALQNAPDRILKYNTLQPVSQLQVSEIIIWDPHTSIYRRIVIY